MPMGAASGGAGEDAHGGGERHGDLREVLLIFDSGGCPRNWHPLDAGAVSEASSALRRWAHGIGFHWMPVQFLSHDGIGIRYWMPALVFRAF